MGAESVYRELQRHLDHGPVPFPAAPSGADLRILERLFTPGEARIVLALSAIPEPFETIRKRIAVERDTLDDLAHRGLIHKFDGNYGKAPLAVGFYEGQVNRLTPELERDLLAYFDECFGAAITAQKTPQLRTVPIQRPLEDNRAIASYDDIRAAVHASPGPFGVMNCICRQGRDLTGSPCRQTAARENCLTIGPAAQTMVERGAARFISREAFLALLDEADREGLVLQPQNTRDPLFICLCCSCCCAVLVALRKLPRPADTCGSNYYADCEAERCQTCGVCGTRCPMEAIRFDDGPAGVVRERCIGCGLCVSTCEPGALRLIAKEKPAKPPRNTAHLYAQLYRERYGATATAQALLARLLGRPV